MADENRTGRVVGGPWLPGSRVALEAIEPGEWVEVEVEYEDGTRAVVPMQAPRVYRTRVIGWEP